MWVGRLAGNSGSRGDGEKMSGPVHIWRAGGEFQIAGDATATRQTKCGHHSLRSCASRVLTANGLVSGNPPFSSPPHKIDIP